MRTRSFEEPSGAHCRSLGFARDDKGEGSPSIDGGDWDGRVRCAASLERNLSIRTTKPNESAKSKFVIPSEAEGSAVRPGWLLEASGSYAPSEARFSFIFFTAQQNQNTPSKEDSSIFRSASFPHHAHQVQVTLRLGDIAHDLLFQCLRRGPASFLPQPAMKEKPKWRLLR